MCQQLGDRETNYNIYVNLLYYLQINKIAMNYVITVN